MTTIICWEKGEDPVLAAYYAYERTPEGYAYGGLLPEWELGFHPPAPEGFRRWLETLEPRIYRRSIFGGDWGGVEFGQHPLSPGEFYPRIWRPGPPTAALADGALNPSCVATGRLVERLKKLFEHVEPDQSTDLAYGHEIRDLLLAACMEVENAWSGVLRANGHPGAHWRTTDYVKLKSVMNLDAYEIRLRWYSSYPAFSPFANWDPAQSTQSLSWYHAYNQTKYARDVHFNQATLRNAIHAVGAPVVMLHAQFGPGAHSARAEFDSQWPEVADRISADLRIQLAPYGRTWRLHDYLIPPADGNWTRARYPLP